MTPEPNEIRWLREDLKIRWLLDDNEELRIQVALLQDEINLRDTVLNEMTEEVLALNAALNTFGSAGLDARRP